MMNYEVVVNHAWTAIFEADSPEDAKEQALSMDEEVPCDDKSMGTDVEVVRLPRITPADSPKRLDAHNESSIVFAEAHTDESVPGLYRRTGDLELVVSDNEGVITNIRINSETAAYLVQTLGECLHSILFAQKGRK